MKGFHPHPQKQIWEGGMFHKKYTFMDVICQNVGKVCFYLRSFHFRKTCEWIKYSICRKTKLNHKQWMHRFDYIILISLHQILHVRKMLIYRVFHEGFSLEALRKSFKGDNWKWLTTGMIVFFFFLFIRLNLINKGWTNYAISCRIKILLWKNYQFIHLSI